MNPKNNTGSFSHGQTLDKGFNTQDKRHQISQFNQQKVTDTGFQTTATFDASHFTASATLSSQPWDQKSD